MSNTVAPADHLPSTESTRFSCLVTAIMVVLALTLTACGDDADGQKEQAAAEEQATAPDDSGPDGTDEDPSDPLKFRNTPPLGTLPDDFPDGIPLPDEYLVLQAFSTTSEDGGLSLQVTLVMGGSVEEQRNIYEAELRDSYGEVIIEPEFVGQPFHFTGDGFEDGQLTLTENDSLMDEVFDTDTTDFPVKMNVSLQEFSR